MLNEVFLPPIRNNTMENTIPKRLLSSPDITIFELIASKQARINRAIAFLY